MEPTEIILVADPDGKGRTGRTYRFADGPMAGHEVELSPSPGCCSFSSVEVWLSDILVGRYEPADLETDRLLWITHEQLQARLR